MALSLSIRRLLKTSSLSNSLYRGIVGKAQPKFDTLAFVRHLERANVTTQQAEALADCLHDIINTSIESSGVDKVKKKEQETFLHQYQMDTEQIRKDVEVLDKTKLTLLKYECDKLQNELGKLNERLQDEVTKLKSGVRLDLSLEKGRIREEHTSQEQRIKDCRNHIDTEIERLRTQIEQSKLDLLKYFLGALVSGVSLTIAYVRLMS